MIARNAEKSWKMPSQRREPSDLQVGELRDTHAVALTDKIP
jgi:hypothetical protein